MEHSLVYPVEDVSNEEDLLGFVQRCVVDDFRARHLYGRLQILHAVFEKDALTGCSVVRATVKLDASGATETELTDVEMQIPALVKELSTLAALVLRGSLLEQFTAYVCDMIGVYVRAHAVSFYCGPGK
jgi:hypothetical protein